MSTPDPTLLFEAAHAAVGHQLYPTASLYVIATPIGNLGDLTVRALHVLSLVDTIACEDTRHTGTLLSRLGLRKPLLAVHEHNEAQAAGLVAERLEAGERVALVSDAGTPAISDPGARLVARLAAQGHRAIPIPGVSSVTAVLSVAGDAAAEGFVFAGFLPARGAARAAAVQALASTTTRSQVLLESPHRIAALLQALAEVLPERRVTIGRELTKQFETVHTAQAAELPAWLAADADRERGEFVVVVHAAGSSRAASDEGDPAASDADGAASEADTALEAQATRTLKVLLAELPLKQAVAIATQLLPWPRKRLYTMALSLKDGAAGE